MVSAVRKTSYMKRDALSAKTADRRNAVEFQFVGSRIAGIS